MKGGCFLCRTCYLGYHGQKRSQDRGSEIQKDYKNLQRHSAALDCVAEDSQGNQYDVEIQQEYEGALPQRARYYSGLRDMNTLDPGKDYEKLPEIYMIFNYTGRCPR